ncbi:MAG: 4-hydroxy-3-methylbut-2-enyl diphosphate reductase [Candidatus Pacebacteria bacterium]|nr:4-hydroxy-3-methylbut-2-enyl diphosphate reductase [Candidatus Paceibacterota bacterium]
MKIIIAKNIGLCTGVKRTLDIADHSLEMDPKPIQFLGEIIHNEKVIKNFEKRGGKIIFNPKEAKKGTLVIRAHGIPPLTFPKNILIRDATCPLVKRAQEAAKTLSQKGYKIIIIGEKNHPEVKGIKGYVNGEAIIIEKESQAKMLKKIKKAGVISQTTQSIERVDKIINILKDKTKELEWINTLCPQVLSRQKELSEIIKKIEGVLVIGSFTSANTQRLVEIVKKNKKSVWLVNSGKDLKKVDFKNISTLGIVSGTSVPDWEIEEIKKFLEGHFKTKGNLIIRNPS